MSRFRDELNVIPAAAGGMAILAYIAATTLAVIVARVPEPGRFFLIVGMGIFPAIYVLLIGYVWGDAKRRGMRHVMWTLLAIFIPNAIGIILFFILRDPLMRSCPACAKAVKTGFTFCPHCGTSVLPICPNCGRGVEPGWANCPNCGTKLPPAGARTV